MTISIPVVNAPYLSVSNLEITITGNTAATVAAGRARNSTNENDIILESTATLNAATTGVNALDTGTLAVSTVYALYVIGDSGGVNASGILLSANQTTPSLPFGYDMFRKIGFLTTNSSSQFISGYFYGSGNMRMFNYDAPQATAITSGNATAYTGVALTTLVPAQANLPVMVQTALTPAAAGNGVFLQPFNGTGDAVINRGQVISVVVQSLNMVMAQLNSSAPSIKYKVTAAGDAVAIRVAGYTYSI